MENNFKSYQPKEIHQLLDTLHDLEDIQKLDNTGIPAYESFYGDKLEDSDVE